MTLIGIFSAGGCEVSCVLPSCLGVLSSLVSSLGVAGLCCMFAFVEPESAGSASAIQFWYFGEARSFQVFWWL